MRYLIQQLSLKAWNLVEVFFSHDYLHDVFLPLDTVGGNGREALIRSL